MTSRTGIAVLFAGLALASRAHASPVLIYVTTTTDANDLSATDGECRTNAKPAAAQCSLRAAIQHANGLTTSDPVYVQVPTGTYSLTVSDSTGDLDRDLDTKRSMTIQRATTTGTVAIQVPLGGNARIFDHASGILTLKNLTLRSGRITGSTNHGGCVRNTASAVLDNVLVTDCRVDGANGGAIYSSGNLTLRGGTIVSSSRTYYAATVVGHGGGVYSIGNGTLTVDTATIADNEAKNGGGIYFQSNAFGSVIANGLALTNNTASTDGGGLHASGVVTMTGSLFEDNSAVNGAGIYQASGTLTASASTRFQHNRASTYGGAIMLVGSTTTSANLDDTAFDDNRAARGGALYATSQLFAVSNATFSNQQATNSGGAIYTQYFLDVSDSSFTSNRAFTTTPSSGAYNGGGAIYSTGELHVTRSSFSNQLAGSTSMVTNIRGGAIFTVDLTLESSTFDNNLGGDGGAIFLGGIGTIDSSTFVANGNDFRGGAIAANLTTGTSLPIHSSTFKGNSAYEGGAIYVENGDVAIANSAFVDTIGGTADIECWSTASVLHSEGYNFLAAHLSTSTPCTVSGSTSLDLLGTNATAKLGALAPNGGPTLTLATATDSVLVEAGNPSGCTSAVDSTTLLTTDQRGQARYDFDGNGVVRCDIGAYERYPLPVIAVSVSAASVLEGAPFVLTFTRSGSAAELVSLSCSGSGGTATSGADYAPGLSVTWPAGDATAKVALLNTMPDAIAEGDETFSLDCTPTSATVTGAPLTLTIQNRP